MPDTIGLDKIGKFLACEKLAYYQSLKLQGGPVVIILLMVTVEVALGVIYSSIHLECASIMIKYILPRNGAA